MPAFIAIGAGIAAGAGAIAVGASAGWAIAAGVGTAIATGVMNKQQQDQAKKQANIARDALGKDIAVAKTSEELEKQRLKIQKELEEKALVEQAQRNQIETLASLVQTKKALEFQPAQQVVLTTPAPAEPNIIEKFNSFIYNLLNR